ncbi:tether containing UBX domain for GLUT4 isoform X2 [Fukomys damarensis]|uniref:tether containing UBX domain for GLUT4 isoform X2 n=1 Tax=Fukomys damarensis TaxID=885580 RepID=UPI00053FF4AB|nr:tether containing UBX domain for GLUT4 isoform X2 [Fukomys damarensis]
MPRDTPPLSDSSPSGVLEDTCRRQDFNPSEYDLKFQRTVLDLSLQWRFANLPNNAKLEMVPLSRSREGPENMVRVALQLDDGSRLQDTFSSGQTLWELLSHFAQTRFVMKQCDPASSQEPGIIRSKTPGSLTCSVSANQAVSSPQLPLNSGELSRGDLNLAEDAGTLETGLGGPQKVDAQEKQNVKEPTPALFIPFSGGGQRLGGPSGSLKPLASPSAKLPTVFSSPGGPSEPKKLKPGEEPQPEPEPELPVDRVPVVCHPDLEDLLEAWPAELPDEFFEVTVDDVRRRLAQLRSERKRLEEAPLVTQAFREAQMKEKLQRYPKVALRVLFPDRYVLQGFFRPSETVGDLRDFVRGHLGNPELPFYLFITPPKTVLDDPTLTLFQANLFPAALVYFGAPEPAGVYLEPGLLARTISPSAADMLVARCMSRTARSPAPQLDPDPVPLESEPAAEEGSVVAPDTISGSGQPVKRSLDKVPKWLKLPASKR